jgi:LDH2 family malate/lactate/ureidoglycolate dehydrogenase
MAYQVSHDDPVQRYPEAAVRGFALDALRAIGASEEEAAIVAEGMVTASLWYHPGQGQGLEKLFRYERRVREGGITPGATMTWVRQAPAAALLDAGSGFGYVAGHRAMQRAVEMARTTGIAMVGVRHSNHFGIAGYHARLAADAGLIGWAFTNAKAEMAPWGSAKPVLGTNPWGIAIPRPGTFPLLLDMALTMSGKGMMRWYENSGRPMPASWALTPAGAETTDPAAAMDGPLLPIGEYKGYGLSLVTDVLAGVMTGALFGFDVFQDESNYDVGHTMMAIDPHLFLGRDAFEQRLATFVDQVTGAPPIDPDRPVRLPGELEHLRSIERRRDGIPISLETVTGLRALAGRVGVACPL